MHAWPLYMDAWGNHDLDSERIALRLDSEWIKAGGLGGVTPLKWLSLSSELVTMHI